MVYSLAVAEIETDIDRKTQRDSERGRESESRKDNGNPFYYRCH